MKLSNEQVQDFLSRIKTKIIQKGMTRSEFYAKSGISSALFSQWNRGQCTPTEKSIARAAQALDTTVESLLPSVVDVDSLKKEPAPDLSESRQELIRCLLNGEISEDTAELLLQIVDKTK